MTVRVLLADDHALFRGALRMVLELAPDMEVVGEAENGHQVLACIGAARPDVVCMDLNMPGLDGVQTTQALRLQYPAVRVIGLSAHMDLARVAQLLDAGALGYVVKGSAAAQLLDAIRCASRNESYLSPDLGPHGADTLAAYRSHDKTSDKIGL